MRISTWLDTFWKPALEDQLECSAAIDLIRFVKNYAYEAATFVESRKSEGGELVILDFRTGRPQGSVCKIKRQERVAIRFIDDDWMPFVYVLREDFPDTAHQNLTAEGDPRSICIDNRSWSEARLTWTPAELLHRILTWFQRAAHGELHDARQPLDPNMFTNGHSFIIARSFLREEADCDLVAVATEKLEVIQVMPFDLAQAEKKISKGCMPLTVIPYHVQPERMKRLDFAPTTFASLVALLEERGIDLMHDLRTRFLNILGVAQPPEWRICGKLVIIIEMPILAPDGNQHGTDTRAFMTADSFGDIAVALGVALKQESSDEGSAVGYLQAMPPCPSDMDALTTMPLLAAEVHITFDRELATRLAGRDNLDKRRVVIVGAGSIGSHVVTCLAREGRFNWTVIDHDRLLPHNLSKHIGFRGNVPRHKADLLCGAIGGILDGGESAKAICANVITKDECDEIDQALDEADIIIDASASILVERFLSDHQTSARRTCIFFNPAGDGAVLLAEPSDRSVKLRDLEAQYLGHVASDEELLDHLSTPERNFAYTGACSAISNIIPQSRIMILSGLVSEGLGKTLDSDEGMIQFWALAENGEVSTRNFTPSISRVVAIKDWTIILDEAVIERVTSMRMAALPDETGGVLLGVVDIPNMMIQIVDASPAPSDSIASPTGFVRGTQGVRDLLDNAYKGTQGQLRYIGEWHSHPLNSSAMPSATDLIQIDWLASLFDMDSLPALMMIAAESGVSVIFASERAEVAGDASAQWTGRRNG